MATWKSYHRLRFAEESLLETIKPILSQIPFIFLAEFAASLEMDFSLRIGGWLCLLLLKVSGDSSGLQPKFCAFHLPIYSASPSG
jgi:hypothetical protein